MIMASKGLNWLQLPIDVTANILKRLSLVDLITSACLVCSLWWNICQDPLMWRKIDMANLRISSHNSYNIKYFEKICIYAIERSCGLLEDIHIEWFASDDLLNCIANRSSHLRRLSLSNCMIYTDKGFGQLVEKLPMLEELDISFNGISKDNFEAIGRSCPLLTSLKFNSFYHEVLYVAKFMPRLRRVKIDKGLITNYELLAILDGCPHLEYLDIHDCYVLDLSGNTEKRCRERFKDIMFPSHPDWL